VISEVNAALRAFLQPGLPAGCEIRFAPPTPAPTGAALELFLADVREDEKAAGTDWEDIRNSNGMVIARRPPVRRFDLHYLITAATDDQELQTRLLDAVLRTIDPGRRLDPALLGDEWADAPVVLRLAGDAAATYARLGLPPRTVLGVVANAPLVLPLKTDLAKPADQISMDVARPGRVPAPAPAARAHRRWRGATVHEEPPGGAHAVRRQDG
jgi:Pvc16 N-terminal domain